MANAWGLSWGTSWAASWDGDFVPPTPTPTPTQTPAGSSRKRRKLYVEIDGQNFEVESAEHARSLLERAREVAKGHAQELATEAVRTTKRVGKKPLALPTPSITSPYPELRQVISDARKAINALYQQTALETELAMLMERKRAAEEDEEEAILLLL